MKKFCEGVNLLGLRRGTPCKGSSVYQVRNKGYCVVHAAIAAKEPHRFREAMETAVRRRVRQEAAARYRDAQVDAFPTFRVESAAYCGVCSSAPCVCTITVLRPM